MSNRAKMISLMMYRLVERPIPLVEAVRLNGPGQFIIKSENEQCYRVRVTKLTPRKTKRKFLEGQRELAFME